METGFISTDMTSHLEGPKADQLKKIIPLRDFGDPQNVADLVMFLAESSYITGQVRLIFRQHIISDCNQIIDVFCTFQLRL